MAKIEEGKRRFREMNYYKNKKEFIKNLIEEIDAMPNWENENNEEVKEEDNKEENKIIEEIKKKDPFEKALEKIENEEKESEEDNKEEKLDEEKIKKTWGALLGGKFKKKLEELKNYNNEEESNEEEDEEDNDKKELEAAAIPINK
jgi:hypothetical protein